MSDKKSQKDLSAALAKGEAEAHGIDAPFFYVTSARMSSDSNNCILTLQRERPVQIRYKDGSMDDGAQIDAVAAVSMSPQTAKDLLLLLQEQISKHEAIWGEIETAYSRRRGTKK